MTIESATDQYIRLVEMRDDLASHGAGCDESTILDAEEHLNLRFPTSYRRILARFGVWDIAGDEYLGINARRRTVNGIEPVNESNRSAGMPRSLLSVMIDGDGASIVLDTSESDESGESPVRVWDPALGPEVVSGVIAPNFVTYALERLRSAGVFS